MAWSRRRFLAGASAVVAAGTVWRVEGAKPAAASRPTTGPLAIDEGEYDWHDAREWGAEGKGFADTVGDYDRLPGRAKGVVREAVWGLSRDSAGLSVGFSAETPAVAVRYELISESIAMPHMPATGVSGVDLYGRDAKGQWRWAGVARPSGQRVVQAIAREMDVVAREYRLYLPLYNGVKRLEVGVPKGVAITPVSPRKGGAVVYYGTSIAQGGCVSRPGVAFTSVLSRRLDRPFVNLAFSGNGKMEEEVGRFMAELDPALWVIDCVPNMTAEMVRERTVPLVRQLRKARPGVPVVLVEDRENGTQWLSAKSAAQWNDRRKGLREGYEKLVAEGVTGLHYLEGGDLVGRDGEGLVDGSHPNDLGSMRYVEALEPVLRKALG